MKNAHIKRHFSLRKLAKELIYNEGENILLEIFERRILREKVGEKRF